jgi:excisionase family DNA binding protein
MDELNLKGKKYISSKRASEITGYTKDYVGQLARGGKISAERVGRAWYIDEEALRAHASLTQVELTDKAVAELNSSREVLVVPEQGEVLPLHHIQISSPVNTLKTWSQVRYLEDEKNLLPHLTAKTKVSDEGSHSVRIHTPSHNRTSLSVVNTGVRKSVDGMAPAKKKVIQPVTYHHAQTHTSFPQKKSHQLSNAHYALLGSTIGIVLAASALVTGFYTPNEWAFSSVEAQSASSVELEDSFFMIVAFFEPIVSGGIALIDDFLALLFGSLSSFFNQGLQFLLQYI